MSAARPPAAVPGVASSSVPPSSSGGSSSVPSSSDGLEDSDGCVHEVFVESTWRGRTVKYDREMQAAGAPPKDAGCQAQQRQSTGVQTDRPNVGHLKADAPVPPAFAGFLARAYPSIVAQLEANLESHAFDDYLVAWEDERDACESVFSLQNTAAINELGVAPPAEHLSPLAAASKKKNRNAPLPEKEPEHAAVTGVSWSCNGAVLVAAYAASSHVGWCNHSSATLSFWNIMRRQISSTKPDFSLEQDCCCMCVAYHPERPTILAGGMFNGEVRVWDTALMEDLTGDTQMEEKDTTGNSTTAAASSSSTATSSSAAASNNPCIMRSSIDDHFHREPIARMEWVRDSNRAWQLVSVSGDGKILFWPMEDPNNKLAFPTDGYILTPGEKYSGQRMGQSHQTAAGSGGGRNKFSVLGGTAIAFAQQGPSMDASTTAAAAAASSATSPTAASTGGGGAIGASHYFVAATEGGGLLRLSLSTILKRKGYLKSGESKWNRDAYRLIEQCDPQAKFDVKKAVEKYAKASGAESIELETIFAARPPPAQLYPSTIDQTYEGHAGPVYGLAFCRFDRRIFASASTDGRIKVFQLMNSRPLLSLDPGSEYLFSLVWSPARPLVFACCSSDGRIFVFDLVSSMLAPSLVIPVASSGGGSGERAAALQSISWNTAEPSLIAAADMRGRVSVFNLSAKYTKMQPGEKRLMEQMANMGK